MIAFKEFISGKKIYKIHMFSNSGATDYGIVLYLGESYPYRLKSNKIIFEKYVSELTLSEKEEFKEFLEKEYQKECEYIQRQEDERQEIQNFIKKHHDSVLNFIPFTYTDHYDTYYLNCNDEDILRQSTPKQINTIDEFNSLCTSDQLHLTIMIARNTTSIETWEDYILD